ncbi:MAG: aldehyde-activating protein [Rhodobacteraceae bacterium]|nr:aldehyde-activating protein [Paracoccaceae bacterium]MAY46831.1 aldehyde-activating protein [Paracoccaceae bacterium]|tara:strand:+ start:83 stop:484 length:402 start_codon:yes stop_codon:yes gene_type:complete
MLTGSCHCGATHWTFEGDPGEATACNCTLCRRYGTLWIYGYEGENITLTGETASYMRNDDHRDNLQIRFCPTCGAVTCWRAATPDARGRTRCAVNTRLAEPDTVAHIPIRHFDGLTTFEDLPLDGRCIRDYWA